MPFPQISFQVRIRSRDSLEEMAGRVGGVLDCAFGPTDDRMFTSGEALEASCLGLHITLSHDPDLPEGELRTYVLIGQLRADIEAQWEIDVPRLNISEYILGVLTIVDSEGWYIPSHEELLDEAGLGRET